MNVKQEIIDSIQVMVDAAIKKVCPIITFGIVVSIEDKKQCIVKINEINYKVAYYGKMPPDINQKCPIFVPFGRMNLAFIMTSGGESSYGDNATNNYDDLTNKPKINNVVLSGNKSTNDLNLQDKLSENQLLAVNSEITAEKVATYDGYGEEIADLDNNKENKIVAGTSGQYWRGDKTWQTLNKDVIGLNNVDNVKQYSSINPPPYPVTSVNDKTGTVTLNFADVGAVAFDDTYYLDANTFYNINGYAKTRDTTVNLPSVCTTATDKWGVIFFIAENASNHTGTQMFFPIAGAYKGRIFYRSLLSGTPTEWELIPKNKVATNDVLGLIKSGGSLTINTDGIAKAKFYDQSISAGVDVMDMGSIDEFGHNKLAYLNPDFLTVEYSNDGGQTWLDYGLSDADKIAMVTTSGVNARIGKKTSDITLDDMVRVTIQAAQSGNGRIYTAADKLLLDISTNGAQNCKAKIETLTIGNVVNGTENWVERGEYPVAGWSGWNSIPFNYTFGGSATQTGQIGKARITLSIGGLPTGSSAGNLTLLSIRLIGHTNWSTPSELARVGRIYTLNTNQDATFPAKISSQDFESPKIKISLNNKRSISTDTSNTGLQFADTTSGDYSMMVGVGSGHVNRGIFDNTLNKWLLYADTSNMYLNGAVVPANPKFTDTIITESDVSGWGFTKNTGTYSKPSGGIPKTDLASDVQTSLGKADTALQSHQDISGKANLSGATFTGAVIAPSLSTGTDDSNYFQTKKFRGEGTASSYYHAVDFGYAGHDKVDFYEYGGVWNFWKNTTAVATTDLNNLALGITTTGLRNKANTFTFPSKSGTFALTDDIPSAVTESTVSGWGFTKNTGTYSKPSGGIPKTDLASDVQTSLGKADSALQSVPTASATVLGGVKVGSGLSISNGVLSVEGGGGGTSVLKFSNITVPTTAWVDNDDSELPYKANVALTGVNNTLVPDVIFDTRNMDDSLRESVCEICESYDGGITLYAYDSILENMTISSITCI